MRRTFITLAMLAAAPFLAPPPIAAQVIYQYQDSGGTVHLSDIQTTSDFRPFFYFRVPLGADRRAVVAAIQRHAKAYGLDPALVTAMVEVESGFNLKAVSPKGAQGLMQIMPGTAKDLNLKDSFDADKNIEAGTRYLKQLLDRFGTAELALAAYNAGPGTVTKAKGVPAIAETRQYLAKVRARYGKTI